MLGDSELGHESGPAPQRTAVRSESPAGLGWLTALAVAGLALTGLLAAPPSSRVAPAAAAAGTAAGWWLIGPPDYAPSGMPDFSQCRPGWAQPGSPAQWTHAGPVALADVLWWLDSVAEPNPKPPTSANDGHRLVTAYPRFGPPRDDHSQENLTLLVEDLSFRADTDGRRGSAPVRGTRWESLVAAVGEYLAARRLAADYLVEVVATPNTAWLQAQVGSGAGTLLLLGVWELQGEGWRRVGGHYAALAGAGPGDDEIAVADPLADYAALSGRGRTLPEDPNQHSCRLAPRAHDDAAFVAHDRYRLAPAAGLSSRLVLQGYFTTLTFGEAAAFQGQNPSRSLEPDSAGWQRGPVVMAVDAALAVIWRASGTALPPPTSTLPAPRATVTHAPRATDAPTPPGLPWPTDLATSGTFWWRPLYVPLASKRDN